MPFPNGFGGEQEAAFVDESVMEPIKLSVHGVGDYSCFLACTKPITASWSSLLGMQKWRELPRFYIPRGRRHGSRVTSPDHSSNPTCADVTAEERGRAQK